MTSDKWNPDQYSKFAVERSKPFFDLLTMVAPVPDGDVIDLGCGTGELTVRLHEKTQAKTTVGLDSSEAMLARARPLASNGLRFESSDIAQFEDLDCFDIVFADASLQWVPDHPGLLARLANGLRPEGQLAIQVPANFDHPSHLLATELARQSPFSEHMPDDWAVAPVLAPERYAELLYETGFSTQEVRLQVYGHELASTNDVFEWTKGTALLRFQRVLPPDLFELFLERYRQRLMVVLGDQTPYFYAFKRILLWGRLSRDSKRPGQKESS